MQQTASDTAYQQAVVYFELDHCVQLLLSAFQQTVQLEPTNERLLS